MLYINIRSHQLSTVRDMFPATYLFFILFCILRISINSGSHDLNFDSKFLVFIHFWKHNVEKVEFFSIPYLSIRRPITFSPGRQQEKRQMGWDLTIWKA